MRILAIIVVVAVVTLPRAAVADWPVFDHDSARSGFAAGDNAITPANVGGLHRRWVSKYDAAADGAPILISNVQSPLNVPHALLFQETLGGTTYALNAATGARVWHNTTSGPGITNSMPAADSTGTYIYAPGVDGKVHRLAASTGEEIRGGGFPLRVTWSPDIEKNGTALNIANGFLYAATGGYLGDGGQYDGHVVVLDLQTGQVQVQNSLCNDVRHLIRTPGQCPQSKSGIWARGGVVVDPAPSMNGRIYAATGNGLFDANTGGHDYGDTVLAMSEDGSALVDTFTPSDYQQLQDGDIDLGSTAPAMLPRQAASNTPLMAVEGGKDGILKLLNRQRLGGVGGELQDLNIGNEVFTAPAVWTDANGATWIFVGTNSDLTGLRLVTSGGISKLKIIWSISIRGTSPIVADGIVFAARDDEVYAVNARTGKVLWSSKQQSAGGTIGGVHWESPIVNNGWLYISDQNANITAYSL